MSVKAAGLQLFTRSLVDHDASKHSRCLTINQDRTVDDSTHKRLDLEKRLKQANKVCAAVMVYTCQTFHPLSASTVT